MFPQYDPQSARQSILKRLPMNAQPVPQHLLAGIAELFGESLTPEQAVGRILETVRQEGDIGLRRWATRLDGDPGQDLRVSETEIQNSLSLVDPGVLQAMQQSAERIEAFHQRQPPRTSRR